MPFHPPKPTLLGMFAGSPNEGGSQGEPKDEREKDDHNASEKLGRDDSMADRVEYMERRLALLEVKLDRVQNELKAARASRRQLWGWRALGGALLAMTLCGISVAAAVPPAPPPTVKVPFKVVDGAGVVMNVTSGGIQLRGPIKVSNRSGDPLTYIGSDGHLTVGHGTRASVTLGSNPDGGDVQVFGKNGKTETVLLSGSASGGVVRISNQIGTVAGALGTDSAGKGAFEIYGPKAPVVQLEAGSHGGYFALANNTGVARVEAGVLAEDLGVVRAEGPGGFNFILGKK
jgi:hypothetical protein